MLIQQLLGIFSVQDTFYGLHHVVHGETEVLEELCAGRRFAVPVDTDHRAFQADVLAPVVAHAGLDRDFGQSRYQDDVLVHRGLTVEDRGAGHGYHPHRDALFAELLFRTHCELNLGPGGDDHRLRFLGVGKNVAAPPDRGDRMRIAFLERYVLAREYERSRSVLAFDRGDPRRGRLDRVTGTPYVHAGYQAQRRSVLHRLVGGTVLAQADRVVGEDENRADPHQRRHSQRISRVVREGEEGAAVGDDAAVQREAVHDRAHAELANAVIDVIAAPFAPDGLGTRPQGEVRPRKIGGSTDEFGQHRRETFERVLRSLARRDRLRLGVDFFQERRAVLLPQGGKLARRAAPELARGLRVGFFVGGESLVPCSFQLSAALSRVPALVDVRRHFERRVTPADVFARGLDFFFAERRAVSVVASRLFWCGFRDHRLAADQRRSRGIGPCVANRRFDCIEVVTVHPANDLPAVRGEALRRLVGKPPRDGPVDRDAVVVVERDEFSQSQRARKRAGFVRDALHQA